MWYEEEFKDTKEAISLSVSYDRSVVSSTNKADLHNITEILLKVALNNITHQPSNILGIEALEKYNLADNGQTLQFVIIYIYV